MKYLKKFESTVNVHNIVGAKLILSTGVYELYLIESKEGVNSIYGEGEDNSWFESYTKLGYMYCIVKKGVHIYTFFVNYDDYGIEEIARPVFSPRLPDVKEVDPFVHELMEKTAKSHDLGEILLKMNGNIKSIKEFWEWSKNSYGQDKSNKDAQTSMVAFNTQHGYGEEGQWVQTQDGDVFIEEIINGTYNGFDRDGESKTGSIKDIIRTLMKKEVIN